MEAPLILEILDRFGKVRERHRLDRFPIRIGRAYDNDVILDDPYVSPHHLELLQDGNGHVLITDLNSENGLFSLHPLARHDVLTVEDNQRVRIGHTDIRVRSTAFPIRETVIDRVRPSQVHLLFTNMVMLPVFWLLTAGVFLEFYYLQSYREVTFNSLVSQILPLFIFIFAWSCGWSIVSKIVTHKFYFSYHAILTALVMAGFYLVEPLFEYVEFLFPINGLADYLSLISDLGLPMILLYGNLRQSTPLSKRSARITAIVSTVLVIGVLHLIAFVHQPEFNSRPQFSSVLKAPMFAPSGGESIDQFFADTKALSEFDIEPDK
ncbi:MAG: FHA domain-containing protein [Gammaproteobacteria bacterium]|nr:FHA domain-containing protein [Gammaproteobacteria bacterium]